MSHSPSDTGSFPVDSDSRALSFPVNKGKFWRIAGRLLETRTAGSGTCFVFVALVF